MYSTYLASEQSAVVGIASRNIVAHLFHWNDSQEAGFEVVHKGTLITLGNFFAHGWEWVILLEPKIILLKLRGRKQHDESSSHSWKCMTLQTVLWGDCTDKRVLCLLCLQMAAAVLREPCARTTNTLRWWKYYYTCNRCWLYHYQTWNKYYFTAQTRRHHL